MAVQTRAQIAANANANANKKENKPHVPPTAQPVDQFGLIQERLQHNLFHLIVQAILWNQTRGSEAKPVLYALLDRYPNPDELAKADEQSLATLLHPIGLYRQRAKRLIAMAQAMQRDPPSPNHLFPARDRRYQRGPDSGTVGWEIAHLPGVGPYALDSFRIFYRDQLRGLSNGWHTTDHEPEWKRVVPLDKDLRAFLQWAWHREGYRWNPLTGKKVKIE